MIMENNTENIVVDDLLLPILQVRVQHRSLL